MDMHTNTDTDTDTQTHMCVNTHMHTYAATPMACIQPMNYHIYITHATPTCQVPSPNWGIAYPLGNESFGQLVAIMRVTFDKTNGFCVEQRIIGETTGGSCVQ